MEKSNRGIDFRKKSFGELAKDYQKYRKPYDRRLYDELFKQIGNKGRSIKILDLGCGTGKSTEPLCSYSDRFKLEIFGCDHDVAMLEEARDSAAKNNLPITYVAGKAEKLPFDDSEFDVVMAGTAFHWFANETALTEIKRVLKTNGMFFVFWKNAATILDDEGNKVGREVYEKFKCKSILGNWRDTGKVQRIFETVSFRDFKTVKFTTEQKDTLEDIIGGHKTNSKYAVLSPAQRVSYIRQLTAAYKKALGDKDHLTSTRETVVCYARK